MLNNPKSLIAMVQTNIEMPYTIHKLVYPEINIRNRGFAYVLAYKKDESIINEVKSRVQEYNEAIASIFSENGFLDFFLEHQLDITVSELKEFCKSMNINKIDFEKKVFSFGEYCFRTQYAIYKDHFFDDEYANRSGIIDIQTNQKIKFFISESATTYPNRNCDKLLYWNWNEKQFDFAVCIYKKLSEIKSIDKRKLRKYYFLDLYDSSLHEDRECMGRLLECLQILIEFGYAEYFSITPDRVFADWIFHVKKDGTIDLIVLDNTFENNKNIIDSINNII